MPGFLYVMDTETIVDVGVRAKVPMSRSSASRCHSANSIGRAAMRKADLSVAFLLLHFKSARVRSTLEKECLDRRGKKMKAVPLESTVRVTDWEVEGKTL